MTYCPICKRYHAGKPCKTEWEQKLTNVRFYNTVINQNLTSLYGAPEPEPTVEVCAKCFQPKKDLTLFNSTVKYCPCEDKAKEAKHDSRLDDIEDGWLDIKVGDTLWLWAHNSHFYSYVAGDYMFNFQQNSLHKTSDRTESAVFYCATCGEDWKDCQLDQGPGRTTIDKATLDKLASLIKSKKRQKQQHKRKEDNNVHCTDRNRRSSIQR